jgi:hypothetical protein
MVWSEKGKVQVFFDDIHYREQSLCYVEAIARDAIGLIQYRRPVLNRRSLMELLPQGEGLLVHQEVRHHCYSIDHDPGRCNRVERELLDERIAQGGLKGGQVLLFCTGCYKRFFQRFLVVSLDKPRVRKP